MIARARRSPRLLLLVALATGPLACGDDPASSGGDVRVNYAIANVAGVFPDQTTLLQGLSALPSGTVGTENATELANPGTMWAYDGAVYVYTFGAPATMAKYAFDATGRAVKEAEMVTPGANTYSTLQFISPTLGYASVAGGLAKLVKFDPTTMRITGEVDLSALNRPGAANSVWYIGSHVRDGKLFLAVDYQNNFGAVYDSAFVAVIDLATDKLESVSADGRTAMIFAAGATASAFAEDGNGDIYVQARGNKDSRGNAPSGVLRIRKGETSFDPDYFFDLDRALGGPAYGIWHFPAHGLTFTFRGGDPDDRWEFKGPNHEMYRIDLAQRTSLGAVSGVPVTKASYTQIMRELEEGRLHFAVAGVSEDAVYTYDIATGRVAKLFSSTGGAFTGLDRVR